MMDGPTRNQHRVFAPSAGAVILGIAAAGLTLSESVQAHTPPLFQVESYVASDDGTHSAFTHMLIYEDDSILRELQNADAASPIVSVQIFLEDGASVEAFTGSVMVDPNVRYIPIDFDVRFSRTGVFAGKMHYEVASAEGVIIKNHHFWIARSESGSSFVSYGDYVQYQQSLIVPIESDELANLEPDDVPGQSVVAPDMVLCEGQVPCSK